MLVYEYPPKLSHSARQAKAIHDLQEHKKMRNNMYKNIILGMVIIGISILCDLLIIRALLILIGCLNMFVAFIIYLFYSLSRDEKCVTKIFDDHIEHMQRCGLTSKYLLINLFYDEIKRSSQTNRGKLVCILENINKSTFYEMDKHGNKNEYNVKDNKIILSFNDTKAKLVLVKDLYNEIKYPHVVYNEIDDTDDGYYNEDDLKWDKLHKHGL